MLSLGPRIDRSRCGSATKVNFLFCILYKQFPVHKTTDEIARKTALTPSPLHFLLVTVVHRVEAVAVSGEVDAGRLRHKVADCTQMEKAVMVKFDLSVADANTAEKSLH